MSEQTLTNTVYIRTTPDALWHALTDGDQSVQYVGARVQSTWRPGDQIVYLTPDGSARLVEGTLVEVTPRTRFVFEGRLVFAPELAADEPHRELFSHTNLQRCGASLKSMLETGRVELEA